MAPVDSATNKRIQDQLAKIREEQARAAAEEARRKAEAEAAAAQAQAQAQTQGAGATTAPTAPAATSAVAGASGASTFVASQGLNNPSLPNISPQGNQPTGDQLQAYRNAVDAVSKAAEVSVEDAAKLVEQVGVDPAATETVIRSLNLSILGRDTSVEELTAYEGVLQEAIPANALQATDVVDYLTHAMTTSPEAAAAGVSPYDAPKWIQQDQALLDADRPHVLTAEGIAAADAANGGTITAANLTAGGTEMGQGVSAEQLRQILVNAPEEKIQQYLPFLNAAMAEAQINTPARVSAFLATLSVESGDFKWFEEIASGAAYEGRSSLGNNQPGDGMRFKGRGPIQLTGRSNYTRAGADLGLDLVGTPEMVATPEVGFRTAAWFWKTNGLNEIADRDDIVGVTKRVTGGALGLDERIQVYQRARQVLGLGLAENVPRTVGNPLPTSIPAPGNYAAGASGGGGGATGSQGWGPGQTYPNAGGAVGSNGDPSRRDPGLEAMFAAAGFRKNPWNPDYQSSYTASSGIKAGQLSGLLAQMAALYGISVAELLAANPEIFKALSEGKEVPANTELKIPFPKPAEGATETTGQAPTAAPASTTAAAGDTFIPPEAGAKDAEIQAFIGTLQGPDTLPVEQLVAPGGAAPLPTLSAGSLGAMTGMISSI